MRKSICILAVFGIAVACQEKPDWGEKIDGFSDSIRKIRGLEAKTNLKVVKGKADAVAARTIKELDSLGLNLVSIEKLFKRLNLLPEKTSLLALVTTFSFSGYAATYDKGIVTIHGEKVDDATFFHELIHAAQDRAFGLDRRPVTMDEGLALACVIEGDAEVSEHLYSGWKDGDLLSEFRKRIDSDYSGFIKGDQNVIKVLQWFGYAQYSYGPCFVQTVRQKDGWDGVNALFVRVPKSTEQVIHPEKYLKGEEPVTFDTIEMELQLMKERFKAEFSTTVGEIGFLGATSYTLQQDCRKAAEGWAGDKIFVMSREKESFVIWLTTWDSEDDAKEAHETLQSYVAKLDGKNSIKLLGKDIVTILAAPEGKAEVIMDAALKSKKVCRSTTELGK